MDDDQNKPADDQGQGVPADDTMGGSVPSAPGEPAEPAAGSEEEIAPPTPVAEPEGEAGGDAGTGDQNPA